MSESTNLERGQCWLPGISRSARAALRDMPVARKFAKANDRDVNLRVHGDGVGLLCDVRDVRGERWFESRLRGQYLVRAMQFGEFSRAPALAQLAVDLAPHARDDAERAALARARQWAVDFTSLAHLFAHLDATRPRPNYEFGEISAVVRSNVQDAIGLRFETVWVPEIRWSKVQVEVKGRPSWTWVGEVFWPEGTRHGASRFSVSAAGASQCRACGHAIRDGGNWCPLVLDGPGGPASLWVGRDCARHLFGCRVMGEGTFAR